MLFTRSKQFYPTIKNNHSTIKKPSFLFKKNVIVNNNIKHENINTNIVKPIIPLNVYQTWFTKDLPKYMQKNINYMKKINPEFTFHLYDDKDCRDFIETYFDQVVVDTFDKLKPGAYKADLWRLCVLYIHGGIYLDIKLVCINGFKLISLTGSEHYVKDRPEPLSIYNALMVCTKGNRFLHYSIQQICYNVMINYYGNSSLDITGPVLLGNIIIKKKYHLIIDLIHIRSTDDKDGYILYNGHRIMKTEYAQYFKERTTCYDKINTKRYTDLWKEKDVYN
jgi:mannosyltransferase OCH1-like enzyme